MAAADSALAACAHAARESDERTAKAAADAAEAVDARLASATLRDPAPYIGLARVISECRIPFAGSHSGGDLASRSERLLLDALALDESSWPARYALALHYFHSPGFLGKTRDAMREFETQLRRQGDAAAFPEQAGPCVYLGDLYVREGRRDEALALWRRGIALFPGDSRLKQRLGQPEVDP